MNMNLVVTTSDDLANAVVLILDAVISAESRRAYVRAVRELLVWCQQNNETDLTKALINRYRSHLISRDLATATINQKLSAIRKLVVELSDNGTLATNVAAAITRVKGVKNHGVRLGRWLTLQEAAEILAAPDAGLLKGKRDRAVLAVMLSCGLRRNELAALLVESVQQRSGRWVLVDIRGKHGRVRSVPMANWCKTLLDEWLTAAGVSSGHVFRAIDKCGRIHGVRISAQAVYAIVTGYGVDIGVSIAPHDLRRSYAKLAHLGKAPVEQIQISLGHSSISTTERYLGIRQDLNDAPCDRIGLDVPGVEPQKSTTEAPSCGQEEDREVA
jgi:site-specific recombinase XerD